MSRSSAWLYICSGLGLQSATSRGSESSSVFTSSSRETVRSGFLRRHFLSAHQPGIKLGLFLELRQVPVRLEERFLNHIFGVLAILRNVLCNAENVAVITPH